MIVFWTLKNRKMKIRVLITAIGTMNCTTIISELKKKDYFYLIGADINPQHCIANSKDVDEFYVFPKVTDDREAYFKFVKSFCVEHKIDFIYCVVDEEVVTLSNHREDLQALGITLCVANSDAITICHDKLLFSSWVEKNIPEINIKRFVSPFDIRECDYPVFIKPIEGRASIGCKIINNISELEKYISHWSNYIVQEYIVGDIVAVDIVSNRNHKQLEIVQRLELLRNSNGCGIAVQIIDDELIRNYCIEIANKLELNGVVNVEFFLTQKGPKIIEVNPRIPAGVEYSCLAGLNVVMNAFYISKGEPCCFQPIQIGRYYAKRYETIEM